jgi:hypothetical protein
VNLYGQSTQNTKHGWQWLPLPGKEMKVKGDIQVRQRDHILMLTDFDYVHTEQWFNLFLSRKMASSLPIMQHTFML